MEVLSESEAVSGAPLPSDQDHVHSRQGKPENGFDGNLGRLLCAYGRSMMQRRRRRNWSSRAFSTIDQKMSIASHSRSRRLAPAVSRRVLVIQLVSWILVNFWRRFFLKWVYHKSTKSGMVEERNNNNNNNCYPRFNQQRRQARQPTPPPRVLPPPAPEQKRIHSSTLRRTGMKRRRPAVDLVRFTNSEGHHATAAARPQNISNVDHKKSARADQPSLSLLCLVWYTTTTHTAHEPPKSTTQQPKQQKSTYTARMY